VSNPEWALKLLDTTTRKLLLLWLRQERDGKADLSRAIEAGQEVVKRCPNELDNTVALSQLLARGDRLEESLKRIDQAIELKAGVADYHRLRASLVERMGRYKTAYQATTSARRLDPTNLDLVKDARRTPKKILIQYVGLSGLFGNRFLKGLL
jgi:tetratricopeptide (TPR) repeat protein